MFMRLFLQGSNIYENLSNFESQNTNIINRKKKKSVFFFLVVFKP